MKIAFEQELRKAERHLKDHVKKEEIKLKSQLDLMIQ